MNYAVVLAGGIGKRMGGNVPKQFMEIDGTPIIVKTLEKFSACDEIDGIVVVSVDVDTVKKLAVNFGIRKIKAIVPGGKTRRESSFIGCKAVRELGGADGDIVLIHDAARPFVTEKIILENIEAAKECGACETAVPVNDTVIRGEGGFLGEIVPREGLLRVQTPQSFKLGLILAAHETAENLSAEEKENITDDASVAAFAGNKVKIVAGNNKNIKITTSDDLR